MVVQSGITQEDSLTLDAVVVEADQMVLQTGPGRKVYVATITYIVS